MTGPGLPDRQMSDLDLTLLNAFLLVAEEGSFTRAAGRLFVSQPSLSNRIRRLEQQVGARLFDRTSRRVSLTRAGAGFYPAASDIVASVRRAVDAARTVEDRDRRMLLLGYVGGAGADLLRAAGSTVHLGTGARLIARPMDFTTDLAAATGDATGAADAVFVHLPVDPGVLETVDLVPVRAEQRVVLLPAGHPLAVRTEIRPRDLLEETFVGPGSLPANRAFWLLHAERNGRGRDLPAPLAARNCEDLLSLVASTGAVATASPSVQGLYAHPGVVYRRLVGAAPAKLAIARPRTGVSPLVGKLLQAVHADPATARLQRAPGQPALSCCSGSASRRAPRAGGTAISTVGTNRPAASTRSPSG